ncbi:PepSY-associated TM helix domain-containing protein, partial [Nostoc sp. NIES-2111]
MKLRPIALVLHRLIGILAGIAIAVISLTGSTLVFWHEIHHELNSALTKVVPQEHIVSIDEVQATVRKAYPNWQISSINMPRSPNNSYA